MPSPRRSTRSAVPPLGSQDRNSSSSSLSSARPDRNTRANNKITPPRTSASPLSSEDGADPQAHGDQAPTRKSKRSQTQDVKESAIVGEDQDEGEPADAADITRCICGHQEYPGPPLTDETKSLDSISDDAGGLFIQCDRCSVWQHGGCVGIFDEEKTPDDYFCELCDKKAHQVMRDSRGQPYSRYLPLYRAEHRSARKESFNKDSDAKARKEREAISRASVDSSGAKRRSTMNSRQAYDEEETLRRVIEESKGANETTGSGSRKGKRSRDESEETKGENKRRRTRSDSAEGTSLMRTNSLETGSDDERDTKTSGTSSKKARSAAVEKERLKEANEREKVKEAQRAEAAGRRKERAGRRRADESEPVEDMPKTEAAATSNSVRETSQPPTPPEIELHPPSSSHKKGGNRKPKRLGRNQYTRDKEFSQRAASPSRRLKNANDSGEDLLNGIGTAHAHSKNSPPVSNDNGHSNGNGTGTGTVGVNETSAVTTSGKGRGNNRWKGKQNKTSTDDSDTAATTAAAAASKDKDKDKDREKGGELSIKDMEKGTQYMLDFINKNINLSVDPLPQQGSASANRVQAQGQALEARDKKRFDSLCLSDQAEELRRNINKWQEQYASTPALSVSSGTA